MCVPLVVVLWAPVAKLEAVGVDSLLLTAFNQLNHIVNRTSFVYNSIWASPQRCKFFGEPHFYSWNVKPNTITNLEWFLPASLVIYLFLTTLGGSAILSCHVEHGTHLLAFCAEESWETTTFGCLR